MSVSPICRRTVGSVLLLAFTPLRAFGQAAPVPPAPAPSATTATTAPAAPSAALPSASAPVATAPVAAPPPPPPPPAQSPARPQGAKPPKGKPPQKPEKPPEKKKSETAERFDRGLQLFDEGDNAGALAEFKRVYELSQNPVVLYNIGLVYAAMTRPVDAVDSLEPALASNGLSPSQRERAERVLADQKARIGRLMVDIKPEGARVEVDSVDTAVTPLKAPIRVAAGSHIVGGVAEGYAPARKEVIVAGNADATVSLELVPTQGKQLANLTVRASLPDADVRIDGEVAGKTPLASSLSVVSGKHEVEVRRPGYMSQARIIDLGEGATGELSFPLVVDPAQLGTEGASLVVDTDQKNTDVTVDDTHQGVYAGPLRLPRGAHHVRLAAAGYVPVDRDVNLDPAQTNTVEVHFDPTPERRAEYESNAHFHRTWGWVGIIAGAALAGGGAAFLAINSSSKSDAKKNVDAASRAITEETGVCDTGSADGDFEACQSNYDSAKNKYDSTKNRDIVGFVGIGVGGAVAVTGLVLLLTGDDPHRYDRPARTSARKTGPRMALTPGPGQVGAGFALTF